MKRKILLGVGVLVAVLGVMMSPILAAFIGNAAPVDGTELPGGARLVADGYALTYVIPLNDHEVALVDSGIDGEGKALMAELKRRNLDEKAVTHIFFTHGHRDHVAAAKKFPNAKLVGMKEEQALLDGKPLHEAPISRMMGNQPTGLTLSLPLNDGDDVVMGEVVAHANLIPGHTDGSAAYLINGVLYLGDSAGLKSDGSLKAAPWVFSMNQEQNVASLKALPAKLGGRPAQKLAFGHTAPGDFKALTDFK